MSDRARPAGSVDLIAYALALVAVLSVAYALARPVEPGLTDGGPVPVSELAALADADRAAREEQTRRALGSRVTFPACPPADSDPRAIPSGCQSRATLPTLGGTSVELEAGCSIGGTPVACRPEPR